MAAFGSTTHAETVGGVRGNATADLLFSMSTTTKMKKICE